MLVNEMQFNIIIHDLKRPHAQLKSRVDNEGKSRGYDGGSQGSILEVGPNSSMFWSGTLLSKARVAPDLRKVWNPCPVDGMFLWVSTHLRASLTRVSITWPNGG